MNAAGSFKENPLVKRKDGFLSGGDYTNPFKIDYDLLLEAISEFKVLKDYKSAMILEQNYGYLMQMELSEIRHKYNFENIEWASYFQTEILKYFPERKF